MSRSNVAPLAGTGWLGRDLADDRSWMLEVPASAFERTVDAAKLVAGRDLLAIERDHLPLGDLDPVVDEIRKALTLGSGRGFAVIRRVPIESMTESEIATLFWGIGLRVGEPVSQNLAGEFMCHVRRPIGIDVPYRGFSSDEELDFHSDSAEIAALLSLEVADSGGQSSVVSLATIHDILAVEHPDLLDVLYQPFCFFRSEEQHEWEAPYSLQPIFAAGPGSFAGFYGRPKIDRAHALPEVPSLTEAQVAALDAFDEVARRPDVRLDYWLEPGDMVFVNNAMVLHARSAFQDGPDPARRRHLLRLWIDSERKSDIPWLVRYDFRYGNCGLARSAVLAGDATIQDHPRRWMTEAARAGR